MPAAKPIPAARFAVDISQPAAFPTRITRYPQSVESIPVDFFADPDGEWEFDSLVEAAGFDPNNPAICVGALAAPFQNHPEGAAVVAEMGAEREYVAIVEYPLEAPAVLATAGERHAASRSQRHDRHAESRAA